MRSGLFSDVMRLSFSFGRNVTPDAAGGGGYSRDTSLLSYDVIKACPAVKNNFGLGEMPAAGEIFL